MSSSNHECIVYTSSSQIPNKSPGTLRVLTGGSFDGFNNLHPGHIASLHAFADPFSNIPLFDLKVGDDIRRLRQDSPVELLVAVPTDETLLRINRSKRPIVPQGIRLERLTKVPGVSGVFLHDGDLGEDAKILKPDAVGFSLTTTGFFGETHTRIRDHVRKMGILALVLPELVRVSTSDNLKKFFGPEKDVVVTNFDFTSGAETKNFPLLYAADLSSIPVETTFYMIKGVIDMFLNEKTNISVLELGDTTGVASGSLILNSLPGQIANIDVVSEREDVLGVKKFNSLRASLFAERYPQLNYILSDWFENVKKSYGLIYIDLPPFLQNDPSRSKNNLPNRILSDMVNHVQRGTVVVIKISAAEGEEQRVLKQIEKHVNLNIVNKESFLLFNEKMIILQF